MRAPKRSYGPAFALVAVLSGWFFLMVAWCSFGWAGVVGLGMFGLFVGAVARSEAARMRRDRERADEEFIRRMATAAVTSPARRARRGGRNGGVR